MRISGLGRAVCGEDGAMITYHFAVHSKRAGIEDLGFMTLANDSEAITFGEQIIRDLTQRDAMPFADWTMGIIEGKRAVCSIPFDAGRQKKYG
jgi:hypothetical protein